MEKQLYYAFNLDEKGNYKDAFVSGDLIRVMDCRNRGYRIFKFPFPGMEEITSFCVTANEKTIGKE